MALRALLTQLKEDPSFTGLCDLLAGPAPARAWVTGLGGSARAFFWAGLAERLQRPLLLVLPTRDEARELYDQLRLFLTHPDPEREELLLFPGRETLPYERALADMDIEGERLEVLLRLARGEKPVVVAALEQVREILPAPAWLQGRCLTLTVGQYAALDRLAEQLVERGYTREVMVAGRGQFAVRGGILDIFPPSDLAPWRVEFEGSEIVTLRRFTLSPDEIATASPAPVSEAKIPPARLFAPTPEEIKAGLAALERERGRELARKLRAELEDDPVGPGRDVYLPDFLPAASLLDYLPAAVVAVVDSPGAGKVRAEEDDLRVARLHQERRRNEPLLPSPEKLYLSFETVGSRLAQRSLVESARLKQTAWEEPPDLPHFTVLIKGTSPLRGNLELLIAEAQALLKQGLSLHVVAHNRAEEQRLRQLLAERAADLAAPDLLGRFEFHLGQLAEGFQYPACRLVVFTDQEIFNRRLGRPQPRRQRGPAYPSQPLADAFELQAGDLAVHRDHGVARYEGVVKLSLDGGEHEFLKLAYAGEEKLYVPMDQLRLVEKYIGGDHAPRINKLGSSAWERTKQRVRESVTELARQLLDIYASRQINQAHAFGADTPWQKEFEDAFPYEETPDQIRAITEVKRDMEKEKPMDRLVCGDVGFGKTEVAMRAAFKATQDGYQVAVLVPTTLLADQHFHTFRERLAAYPVRIEMISRFRKPADQALIKRELAQGAIDIIIGTHKLLGKDVHFKKLGLVVVDEEQHFGVSHKEKLKEIRSTVDVLTLTATPIPRTLYLSLSGIRDISVIETPPLNRLSIRTFVMEYSEDVIREAVVRELARGGQVFFIHNRVHSIGPMAERIKKLVPEARVEIAHGQMSEQELEPVMERFISRGVDVLVSTSIVESGLDLPNVNTILINRADALGMAQLYQLRGRVGRADRQAYAYLFYPLGGAVTGQAEKRLSTLQEFTELGSGFKIAMRDLEIRGSGDILGAEQSGQVAAVGFETYCSLLEEAVRELRGQRQEGPAEVKLALPVDAYLPAEYVPDTIVRLNLYKRIAGAEKPAELQELSREMENRYGRLPEPAQKLIAVADLKLLARERGLEEVTVGEHTLRLQWRLWVKPSQDAVARWLADRTRRVRFIPGEQAAVEMARPSGEILIAVKGVLSELAEK
jgi:transcription-repair coupling factor (superfamily II helicase)